MLYILQYSLLRACTYTLVTSVFAYALFTLQGTFASRLVLLLTCVHSSTKQLPDNFVKSYSKAAKRALHSFLTQAKLTDYFLSIFLVSSCECCRKGYLWMPSNNQSLLLLSFHFGVHVKSSLFTVTRRRVFNTLTLYFLVPHERYEAKTLANFQSGFPMPWLS